MGWELFQVFCIVVLAISLSMVSMPYNYVPLIIALLDPWSSYLQTRTLICCFLVNLPPFTMKAWMLLICDSIFTMLLICDFIFTLQLFLFHFHSMVMQLVFIYLDFVEFPSLNESLFSNTILHFLMRLLHLDVNWSG